MTTRAQMEPERESYLAKSHGEQIATITTAIDRVVAGLAGRDVSIEEARDAACCVDGGDRPSPEAHAPRTSTRQSRPEARSATGN